jgi:hypothetical protein
MKKIIFIIIGFAVFLLIYMRINRESYINVVDSNNNIKVDFIISKGGG